MLGYQIVRAGSAWFLMGTMVLCSQPAHAQGGWFVPPRDGTPYQLTSEPDPTFVTPVIGRCSAYAAWLGRTADLAADPAAKGWGGETKFDIVPDLLMTVKGTQHFSKFECGCTNRLYDSSSQCLKECHVSLACFTNICGEEKPKICRTATLPRACRLDVHRIDVRWWTPVLPVNPQTEQCFNAAQKNNDAILTHEKAHVSGLVAFLDQWNQNNPGEVGPVTSCADSESEADAMNLEKLKALQGDPCRDLADEYRGSQFNVDNISTNPFKHPLDCSVCPSTVQ